MISLFMDRSKPSKESLSGDPFDDRWYTVDPGTGYAYLPTSGVHVNEQIAMTYSACWAATMLLCSAISMLPLKLFRKLPNGGSEPAVDDPRYYMVHDAPNEDMISMMFRSSRTDQQINWGNSFAEIRRTVGGRSISLDPIHASRIPRDNITRGSDGRLRYKVNQQSGPPREIHADNMLHFTSPMSDDGVFGKGVVTAARRSIGFGIATETHGSAYFQNAARPNLLIKGARFRKKEDADEFRRQFTEIHGSPANNAKPAILPPDTDVEVLQFNAQDSQFLETRQFSIDDIARWYGIPPHTIGSLLRATNNNIEQMALDLEKYALMRWTVPQEQEMNRKLLSREERKTLFFLHVFEGLERADLTTRTNALKEQFFNGEITLNEWRALENRSPIGPLGDLHFVQSAMVPLEIAAKGPQQPTNLDGEQGPSEADELRQRMETYGIGVRAGTITPQTNDEDQYRQALGLPPMTEEAKAAWKEDKGIRRPITLQPSGDKAPASPFGQPKAEEEPQDEPKASPEDDGLSRLVEEFAQLKQDWSAVNTAEGDRKAEELARLEAVAKTLSEMEQRAISAQQTQQKLATAMLRDVMGRMLSVEIHKVKHIAEKPNKFDARLREFYESHSSTLTRALTEPVSVCLAAAGDPRNPAEVVQTITTSHVQESLRQLDSCMDCLPDELPAKVDQCVSSWHEERAGVVV